MKTNGVLLRASYQVGRRLFGQVPTPQTLMAERPAMMLGIGGLWTAIEYGGHRDSELPVVPEAVRQGPHPPDADGRAASHDARDRRPLDRHRVRRHRGPRAAG